MYVVCQTKLVCSWDRFIPSKIECSIKVIHSNNIVTNAIAVYEYFNSFDDRISDVEFGFKSKIDHSKSKKHFFLKLLLFCQIERESIWWCINSKLWKSGNTPLEKFSLYHLTRPHSSWVFNLCNILICYANAYSHSSKNGLAPNQSMPVLDIWDIKITYLFHFHAFFINNSSTILANSK